MMNFTKVRSRFLLSGLILITTTGVVEASSGHHYNNRHYNYGRGHYASYLYSYPLGHRLSLFPTGYLSLGYAGPHYYNYPGVYYRWNGSRRSYVVDGPYAITGVGTATVGISEQFVYPRQGQSTTRTSRDRYECYLWAVNQTGVEPAQVNNTNTTNSLEDYQRANGACLEARGYSVK